MTVPDPGSFRDPRSRVVHDGDRVIRLLDARGAQNWRAVARTPFFERSVADGRVIETWELSDAPLGAETALEHRRLPVITYPYEWTFSMLKAAALLQLDLLADALAEGVTMKDATPFNVQFLGPRPVFIDVGSFEPYRDGDPWMGYRQFTRQYLFPLMMEAWVGVPFQPWLRGDPAGPRAEDMRRMLPRRRLLSAAGLSHVVLQTRLERRFAGRSLRSELRQAGFSSDLILANIRRLRKLVLRLQRDSTRTVWADYATLTHVERDRETKGRFLMEALEQVVPGVVLDLGANDGYFSRLASRSGAHVVAVDADEEVLDRLWASLEDEAVSVVVSDVANPSPAQGWAGTERASLFDRVDPDLVVAYGLIHHLMYTTNVPMQELLTWLASFQCPLVVEFVDVDDPMVRRLVANRTDTELHPLRTVEQFRHRLGELFSEVREQPLPSGHRTLFFLLPR